MAYAPGTSEYLLELLCCGLNDLVPTQKPDEIPWADVYAFAKEHGVSSFAYHIAQALLPDVEDCAGPWRDSYNAHLIQESNQNYELDHLCTLFSQQGIPHAPLKGACIRSLFPLPFLREMCDLDILIHGKDLETVHEIMLEEGYLYEAEHTTSNNREYHKKPYLNVEIHTDLLPKESDLYWYYEDIWDRLLPTAEEFRYCLKWDDIYIFSVAHAYKHYCLFGIGIRAVLDLYVLENRMRDQLCRSYILGELRKLGLEEFHNQLEAIGQRWFSPDGSACTADAILSQEILEGAVYGHNRGIVVNGIYREMRSGKSIGAAKRSYLRRKIFPGCAFMRSAYPVLNKAPVLYPLFWPVRWISILLHKPEVIKQHFSETRSVDL